MREIPLTNSNKVALVDDEDYESVSRYKWRLSAGVYTLYAMRTLEAHENNGVRSTLKMQLQLMNPPDGFQVDHKDGDGLNNQRNTNLRLATPTQNQANRGRQKRNKSGVKGVSWIKARGKWGAFICINYKRSNLGSFKTKEEAAEAYRKAAVELYGEFACLDKHTGANRSEVPFAT
jgi:AP2 domain/HNH endonuclease